MQKNELCSNPEQLLVRYFLLVIQNQRLQEIVHNQSYRENKGEELVLKRINQIEAEMSSDLKNKEQKIHELNRHIRQMHSLNQQLSNNVQTWKTKYRNLQQAYVSEMAAYKLKLETTQNRYMELIKPCSGCQQSKSKQELQKNQKEQLYSQIQRLQTVTVKQLESNIDLLSRQNQSYMLSINNYRTEINNYKSQKERLEQQIRKLNQKANLSALSQFEWQKEMNEQKMESNKIKNQYEELKRKYKTQIQNIVRDHKTEIEKIDKNHEKYIDEVSERSKQKENDISTLKQQVRKYAEELERKSKKLKQYDDQYALYVNKMAAITHQISGLKAQNGKLKDKLTQILKQSDKKTKQIQDMCKQVSRVRSQCEIKIVQTEQLSRKQKVQQIKILQKEIQSLKQELQNLSQDEQQKLKEIEKQRDKAIEQWQEIAKEMKTQKQIISCLEKQIDSYRKQSCDQMRRSISSKHHSIQEQDARSSFPAQHQRSKNYERLKTEQFSEYKANEQILKSTRGQLLDNQNKYYFISKLCTAGTIQKNGSAKTKQEFVEPICCAQCKSNGTQSVRNNESQRPERLSYRSLQTPRQEPLRIDKTHPNLIVNYRQERIEGTVEQRESLRQINQKIPLSYKRKDDKFKKYQLQRNKTEETFTQTNQYSNPSAKVKEAQFFTQKQAMLNKGQFRPQRNYSSNSSYCRNTYQIGRGDQMINHRISRQQSQKNMKSSSLPRAESDRNLEQIQQYLSFDLNQLKIGTSLSQKRIGANNSRQLQSKAFIYDSGPEKNLLEEKIASISSFRQQNQSSKQSKFYNFCKKPLQQGGLQRKQRKADKENINQIIHRKCQFLKDA